MAPSSPRAPGATQHSRGASQLSLRGQGGGEVLSPPPLPPDPQPPSLVSGGENRHASAAANRRLILKQASFNRRSPSAEPVLSLLKGYGMLREGADRGRGRHLDFRPDEKPPS